MDLIFSGFSAPKNVNIDFDSLYAPAERQLQMKPQFLDKFLQYNLPRVSRSYGSAVDRINATVDDPRLKTISRLRAMDSLASTMQSGIGEASARQEGAEMQQQFKLSDLYAEKGSDIANLKMFNTARKDAYKSAMLGFWGNMISAGANVAGAPGFMSSMINLFKGGSELPDFSNYFRA